MPLWCNYGKNQCSRPAQIHKPGSLEELRQLVSKAAREGRRVKAAGSKHSYSSVVLPDDSEILIDLGKDNEKLKRRVLLPKSLSTSDWDSKHLVALETSVNVADLSEWLDARGLAMSTLGAVNEQTIVGAMATGTHGSDLEFGPLANMTRAFLLVDGRGKVKLIQPTKPLFRSSESFGIPGDECAWLVDAIRCAEVVNDDDVFNSCVMGIGVAGVIYAVVVEAEPQFGLRETTKLTTWESVKQFVRLPEEWTRAKDQWMLARKQHSGKELRQAKQRWAAVQAETLRKFTARLLKEIPGLANGDDVTADNVRTLSFTLNPYATHDNGEHTATVTLTTMLPQPQTAALQRGTCPAAPDVFQSLDEGLCQRSPTLAGRRSLFRGIKWLFGVIFGRVGWDEFLTNLFVRFLRLVPFSIPTIIDERLERFQTPDGGREGPSHKILTRDIYAVVGWGIEVGMSLDTMADAIDNVLQKVEELRGQHRYLTGYLAMRFVAMTDALLGMSFLETKGLVELTMLKDTPHTEYTLPELQRLLIDKHDGVFHWGLDWDASKAKDVERDFPELAKFKTILHEQLDPDQVFSNEYTRRLGIYDRD